MQFKPWLQFKKIVHYYTADGVATSEFRSVLTAALTNEPPHGKTNNLHKTKAPISFAVTAKLISAFVFATRIIKFLLYLYRKFHASSHPLRLHRPVYVGPGRKPRRPVFLRRGSNVKIKGDFKSSL